MSPDMNRGFFACLLVLVLIVAGCASARSENAKAHAEAVEGVRVEVVPSDVVELATPNVRREGNAIIISGTAARKPSAAAMLASASNASNASNASSAAGGAASAPSIDGHIDLTLLAKAENDDDPVPLTLTPVPDARSGPTPTLWRYELRVADVVPHAIVRVQFSDDDITDTTAADGGVSNGGSAFHGYPSGGDYSTHTPGTPHQAGSNGSRSNGRSNLGGHSSSGGGRYGRGGGGGRGFGGMR